PPRRAMRDQDGIARLFLTLRELDQKEGGAAPEPLLSMTCNYDNPAAPSLEEVAKEINGREIASGRQLSGFGELKDDGSTLCGNWLYSGSFTEAGNMMARRGQEDPTGLGFYPTWPWHCPANRRALYDRASADADVRPW